MALKEKHLGDGESVVLSIRTHWKALAGPIALALFLLALLWAVWWFTRDLSYGNWVTIAGAVLAALIAAWFVLVPILRWSTERYVITNRRLSHRSGILTKIGRDIPLHRINDIGIEKGVLDRILGCGTLIVSDATDKAGMELHDVPRVEDVQVQLQNLLFAGDDGSDDGEWPPNEPRRARGRG
ncbi:PH domain-containing protein [Ornithinimicrobium cryptoxanthini]|uniref:PH domain-containing protein n=1 Tax=Ornithinimicrobium cryptoxanthini TaxID=2934161 RepID=A0ABY4YE23_9MICO|nr:PH domain-containing protein [Ornithinimicrobium cryptoxanthini]USQ74805.1 PH domain-containing protein [Ornithinimicrobium cryptoxanthini]